mgnify:CR=1 FL=1
MYTYQGKALRIGRGWTDAEGIKHPSNWNNWDDATKAAKGLVWVDDPAPFDNRFYWDATTPKNINDVDAVDEDGNPVLDEKGEQVITRGLKWNAIQTVKAQAGSLLAPTDWMVIKAAEVGDYTVPSDITTYRAAVRTASNTIEAAITACDTHDAFMALYDTPVDADGVPTGNAPINDWPDAL